MYLKKRSSDERAGLLSEAKKSEELARVQNPRWGFWTFSKGTYPRAIPCLTAKNFI